MFSDHVFSSCNLWARAMSDESNASDGNDNWDELADFLGKEGASDQLDVDEDESGELEESSSVTDEAPEDGGVEEAEENEGELLVEGDDEEVEGWAHPYKVE